MDNLVATPIDMKPRELVPLNCEDSQQIEDRNVRFLHESQHFLSLFPKEVWDHICSFLDSKDFHSLINSSPFFRELFLKKRIFLLFEPVLEIMLPTIGSYFDPPCSKHHQDRNARSVLVHTRATCETWKRSIDKMAINWNQDKKSSSTVNSLLSVNYRFHEFSQIDEFLHYFKESHPSNVNPFVGKYIYLYLRLEEPDLQRLTNRISRLLEKYGKHVWTCEISISFGHTNPPDIHLKIIEWINYMPNLQNLRAYYLYHIRVNSENDVQLEVIPPKLKYLRKLVVQTFSPVFEDVHLPDWSWIERYQLSKLVNQHENLELLHITIFNRRDAEYLKNLNSPLKKLVAQYNCKEDDVKLYEVFTMLSEKFSKSLEDVEIRFRVSNKPSAHMKIMQDSFNGRLNLLKVTKLEIRIISGYCLDFLLGLKDNLEELTVTCVSGRPGYYEYSGFSEEQRTEIGELESKQSIKFLGYQDKMLESNIWSLFPDLKNICLNTVLGKSKEFSRRDWIKLQRLN